MYIIKPLSKTKKEIVVPADKSISHRAIILSSLCEGETCIKPFLESEDASATLECMRKLGIVAKSSGDSLTITGAGMYLKPKETPVTLLAGESGTTMRILSGLLSCQKFPITFEAAPSLVKRPMGRVVLPLQQMGARISGTAGKAKITHEDVIYPPLHIKPAVGINGGRFRLNVSSAQVKSSLMLASLYAKTQTVISEPYKSRDHTERMLKLFGAKIKIKGTTVTCKPVKKLISPKKLFVPGDFSSAAFFIVLGLILKNSKIVIKNVNINPTRCGLLQVLRRMGGKIKIKNKKNAYESYADIVVESSTLKAVKVEPEEIPSMIDEVPILCVASAFAEGKTEIRGVRELRIKETDRVWSMVHNLSEAGIDIYNARFDNDEEIVIKGSKNIRPASFVSSFDHRIAMSMIIFGMALNKESEIDDITCINKSFPQFLSLVKSLHRCG